VIRGSVAVIALLVLATGGSGAAARSAASNSDVYSIALDGTDLRRLTETPDSEEYLSRSPDGTRLAYYATNDGRSWWVYVSNSDGTERRRVASYSRSDNFREPPAWSRDGRQIAYTQGFGCTGAICEVEEVWATDVVGGQSRRLARSAVQPAWSATRLAFTRAKLITSGREPSYRLRVVLARLDGSRPRVVVRGAEGASWSPSGRFLAYRGFDGFGPVHVFRIRRDGAGRRRLANGFDPLVVAWSPSGRHVAFVARTLPTVYVVRANGRGLRALGRIDLDSEQGLSWSPDGRRLAWPRGKRIFVQAAVGGPRRTISIGKDVLGVVWSADGRRLFFVAA
jgi:Tol biopolymer transport system component